MQFSTKNKIAHEDYGSSQVSDAKKETIVTGLNPTDSVITESKQEEIAEAVLDIYHTEEAVNSALESYAGIFINNNIHYNHFKQSSEGFIDSATAMIKKVIDYIKGVIKRFLDLFRSKKKEEEVKSTKDDIEKAEEDIKNTVAGESNDSEAGVNGDKEAAPDDTSKSDEAGKRITEEVKKVLATPNVEATNDTGSVNTVKSIDRKNVTTAVVNMLRVANPGYLKQSGIVIETYDEFKKLFKDFLSLYTGNLSAFPAIVDSMIEGYNKFYVTNADMFAYSDNIAKIAVKSNSNVFGRLLKNKGLYSNTTFKIPSESNEHNCAGFMVKPHSVLYINGGSRITPITVSNIAPAVEPDINKLSENIKLPYISSEQFSELRKMADTEAAAQLALAKNIESLFGKIGSLVTKLESMIKTANESDHEKILKLKNFISDLNTLSSNAMNSYMLTGGIGLTVLKPIIGYYRDIHISISRNMK